MRGFFEGLWSYGAKGLSQMQLLFWGLGQLGLLENTGLLGALGLLGLLKNLGLLVNLLLRDCPEALAHQLISSLLAHFNSEIIKIHADDAAENLLGRTGVDVERAIVSGTHNAISGGRSERRERNFGREPFTNWLFTCYAVGNCQASCGLHHTCIVVYEAEIELRSLQGFGNIAFETHLNIAHRCGIGNGCRQREASEIKVSPPPTVGYFALNAVEFAISCCGGELCSGLCGLVSTPRPPAKLAVEVAEHP